MTSTLRRSLVLPALLLLAAIGLSACITYSGPTELVDSARSQVADPEDPSQTYEIEMNVYVRDTTQTVPGFGGGREYIGTTFITQTIITRPDGTQFVLVVPPGRFLETTSGLFGRTSERGFPTAEEAALAAQEEILAAIAEDSAGTLYLEPAGAANLLHSDLMFATVDAVTN
ncbi:hypothetical protein [Hasllibacter sp. MH4015]|uniref:hypothetical protein n=1 Tax=Hasllibacter sp. MH4015 TaxID=2854029 RepID=UPI001CD6A2CA|nr:hypothetical protein [Hasllibacter sp. MH4015]